MPTTLAVVGGGASGALVALHALARPGVRVVLIEPRADVGRGVAYSTPHAAHRLNVPAGRMSAFPDAPDGFLDWLRAGPLPAATAATFAPRALFGRYLAETLARAAAAPGASLRTVRDTAVAVTAGGTVRLASTTCSTRTASCWRSGRRRPARCLRSQACPPASSWRIRGLRARSTGSARACFSSGPG